MFLHDFFGNKRNTTTNADADNIQSDSPGVSKSRGGPVVALQ